MKKSQTLILLVASLVGMTMAISASAHDFSVKTKSGNEFFFNVLDTLNNTVEITYEGEYNRPDHVTVRGDVIIPDTFNHQGKDYTVTVIGGKAFSGCGMIKSVSIPSTVTRIEEYAFENCDSLTSVIFPACVVEIGKGAFRKCSSISDITFGSDWKTVDLALFSWSEKLRIVNIPAKVNKLTNLRMVKTLEAVNVDGNNSAFSSVDGLLCSKRKTVLYACPVAHEGTVDVPEGVEQVLRGAFLNCNMVEKVTLPASLAEISFDEFFRMEALQEIDFKNMEPVKTVVVDGNPVSAFKVSPKVAIYVPKSAYQNYVDCLWSAGGTCTSLDGKNTFECNQEELLKENQIKKSRK